MIHGLSRASQDPLKETSEGTAGIIWATDVLGTFSDEEQLWLSDERCRRTRIGRALFH